MNEEKRNFTIGNRVRHVSSDMIMTVLGHAVLVYPFENNRPKNRIFHFGYRVEFKIGGNHFSDSFTESELVSL